MRTTICAMLGMLLSPSPVIAADGTELPVGNDEACMAGPLAQFGRYVGRWDIEDSRLSQENGMLVR